MNTFQPASDRPGPFGRLLYRVSVVVAAFGGLSLLGIMLLTVASVIGRELFDSPIPGDFELVEIWCAIAVFAFLPYCQMVRGNVVVDLFTESASVHTRAALELIGNLLFTVISAVLTWRLALGGIDLANYHEETMVLRVPLWWGFVPGVLAMALLTVVCAYTAWRSQMEYIYGRRIDSMGEPLSNFAIGVLSFPLMLLLMAFRIPIGVAMLAVGAGGYVMMSGLAPLLNHLKTGPYFLFQSYALSVIPLFLPMGQFALRAGMSRALFQGAYVWLGHHRGGIAMAGIGGCAGFGAICGSSLATAATMAQVALPEMRRLGYSGALATGTLAAGGTLGILIPPSVILVIYALLTEQNIAKMFIAAFIPAALAVGGFMAAVAIYVRLFPDEGPAAPKASTAERLSSLFEVWPVLLIFGLVIGGIYGGLFTPTEGAAVGAFGTGALALARGHMDWPGLLGCLKDTAAVTAMIFLILLGAELYNSFLALTRMPMEAAQMIQQTALPAYGVMIVILPFYLVLGCLMDSLSMILLTVPILFPIVMALDFGLTPEETAIWFGILALVVVELGLITPPVGLNAFVIHSLAPDVPMLKVFRGVVPFLLAEVVRVALLLAFPGISLWLVRALW